MPGNIIKVNDDSKYYVGDSKMPDLIKWLNTNGIAQNRAAKSLIKEATKTSTNKQSTSALQIAEQMDKEVVYCLTINEDIEPNVVSQWAQQLRAL